MRMTELSEGRFDPTIEPLQKLWKEHLAQGTVPSKPQIDALLPAIGWNKIHLSKGKICKDHDLTSLDLGGIAKGYCVDLLVERLNANGYPSIFVEWGGEIRTSGQHPDNRPWTIFISRFGNPDPEKALAILTLRNQAIATSGDYIQQWKVQKENTGEEAVYFHIIDPLTGQPLCFFIEQHRQR